MSVNFKFLAERFLLGLCENDFKKSNKYLKLMMEYKIKERIRKEYAKKNLF